MGDFPQAAIDMLPLSAEPMSQWKKDTDIRLFAYTFYADSDVPSFGSKVCAEFEKDMREQARAFTKTLMEASEPPTYLDFYQDAQFGQAAKYSIALKCCIFSLLEDAGFYSLAHVLEAETELESSLILASNCYYKQASLMLRSLLGRLYPIARQKGKGRVSFFPNSYEGKRRDADSAKKDYTSVAPV